MIGITFRRSFFRLLCTYAAFLLWLWFFAFLGTSLVWAHDPSPDPLREIAFEQKLNQQAPLNLTFQDESGKLVQLDAYFGDKPVILVFAYYECPNLCSVVLEELVDSLQALTFNIGDEFRVVTVSINPDDTSTLAAAKKQVALQRYARPGVESGWHFLIGEHTSIDQLAEAVGFQYAYDAKSDQYAHAAGIIILTPQGKISRYFYGLEYSPSDLRLGLVEASANKIGTFVDQMLLRCFEYDPVTGTYTPIVMNILRLAGLATVLTIGVSLWMMLRRGRRNNSSIQ